MRDEKGRFIKGHAYAATGKTLFKVGHNPWNKGKTSEHDDRILINEKHGNWKGDKVGYYALHTWVSRKLGTPRVCENCGTEDAKQYEWHNINALYKRVLGDWQRLCRSCHAQIHYGGLRCVI